MYMINLQKDHREIENLHFNKLKFNLHYLQTATLISGKCSQDVVTDRYRGLRIGGILMYHYYKCAIVCKLADC